MYFLHSKSNNIKHILLLLIILGYQISGNTEEYQSKENFLYQAFSEPPPKAKLFWIQKALQPSVKKILQHKPGFIRTRYWQNDSQTVWILQEIGKTKPIKVGIIIQNHRITKIKVLAFQESRGWEVKHAFFTDQFKDISISDDLSLDKPIDGISGATLSVRALKKIAQLALFFDQQLLKELKEVSSD